MRHVWYHDAMDSDTKANGASTNGLSGASEVVGPKRRRRGGVAPAATASETVVEAAPPPAPPAPAPPVETKKLSPNFRRIPQPDLAADEKPEENWEESPSAFIYDSKSNGERPVKMLCTDTRLWPGLGEVIYARATSPITVTLPSGELFETPAKVTIAFPACNELLEIVRLLEANPQGVVEAKFAPIGERPTDLGKNVMHYRVRCRVVPGLSREDAWRGG